MFWRLSFLICTIYAVDVTTTYYSSVLCDVDTITDTTTSVSPLATCAALQLALNDECTNDFAIFGCAIVIGECITGDFVFNKSPLAQGMIYECLETTPAPTDMPTEATCDDNVENGDEEGVDCGGVDCDPCPTDCELYDCGSTHSLILNPETVFCAAYPCGPSDLTTCCDINALCSTIATSVGCGNGKVESQTSGSTYCGNTVCEPRDQDLCCVDAGTCENFAMCNDTTHYLRDNPQNLFCDSEVCDESDIGNCCAAKAKCSQMQCNLDQGYNNVLNDENVYCEKNPCVDADNSTCCAPRASCATFTCIEERYVDEVNKSSLWCYESVCADSDWEYCCIEKDTCEDDYDIYSCGSTGNALVANPREVYCADTECQSPQDDDVCCPPPAIACNSDACDLDLFFVDFSENCTSDPCTTSDTQCCIQRAQCSIDICNADTQVVNNSVLCAVDVCESMDSSNCCLDRQSCGTYNCDNGQDLISAAYCGTEICDEEDIENCCTIIGGSSGSGTDGTIIAIAVVGGLVGAGIIFGVVYKIKAKKGL